MVLIESTSQAASARGELPTYTTQSTFPSCTSCFHPDLTSPDPIIRKSSHVAVLLFVPWAGHATETTFEISSSLQDTRRRDQRRRVSLTFRPESEMSMALSVEPG